MQSAPDQTSSSSTGYLSAGRSLKRPAGNRRVSSNESQVTKITAQALRRTAGPLVRLGTHVRSVWVASRGIVGVGCLIVHILAGGVGPGLRTDRRRIRMLRLVGIIARRRLIMFLFPRRVGAGVGTERLAGGNRWCHSYGSRARAGRRQRRYGLCVGCRCNSTQQRYTKDSRFEQTRHTAFSG